VLDRRALRHTLLRLPAVVLIAVLAAIGCSEEQKSTSSASGGSLRLESFVSTPALLGPGGEAQLAARVVNARGEAVAAATVRFGESGAPFEQAGAGAAGAFDPAAALTDDAGWARTTFRSHPTSSGRVDLKAGAGSAVAYLSLYLTSGVSGAGTAIAVTAPETSLPADGQSTLELTIQVARDGAPAASAVVRLAAGELFEDLDGSGDFSDGDRILIDGDADGEWTANGSVTSPVTTGPSGTATAIYTAGILPGSVFVKATVDTVSVDFALDLHAVGAALRLAALPVEVWADGFSGVAVTAEVQDRQGAPLAGKLVRFTAGEPFTDADGDGFYTPGTDPFTDTNGNSVWDVMGTITSSATTGTDGRAVAQFTAGRAAGTATIYASTRDGGSALPVRLLPLPRVDRAEWAWSAGPVYANELSGATLSARLLDVNGSPIPGKSIALSASAGTVPPQAHADAEGTVTALYRAPAAPGTAWVTLAADDWSLAVPIEVLPLPALLAMDLAAEPVEICLLGAGGTDRATLSAVCLQLDGSPAPAGLPLLFEIEAGPGGGEVFEPSGAARATVLTGADGLATAVLRAGTLPGLARVRVSGGGLERALDLAVSVGPPAAISVHPDAADLASWQQTAIRATVRDAYNNPVKDGTRIFFEVDEGLITGEGGQASSPTASGLAIGLYYSLSPEPGGDGVAQIVARAEPNGVEGRTSVAIPMAGETVRVLSVAAEPAELRVAGQADADRSVLTATCSLRPGLPAPAGLPVRFEILHGPQGGEGFAGGASPITVETNTAGVAVAVLNSGTRSGPLHLRVSAGETQRDLYLGISAGPPAGVHCWPERGDCAPGDTVRIFGVIDDEFHNPVVDGTVAYFTTDRGFIYTSGGAATAPTAGGMVTAFYIALLEDTTAAYATITCAAAGGVSGQTTIQLREPATPPDPGPIARMELIPTRTEIGVAGTGATEQCGFYALCYDAENHPVGRGREVTFEIVAGPGGGEGLDGNGWGPVTRYTDDTSRASVVLSSGTASGTVLVEASAGAWAGKSAQVSIAAGPPAYISLGASPRNIRGWDVVGAEADVLAIVSDLHNNPVAEGTTIYLTCDEGIVRGWDGSLGSAVTQGGMARGTYFSGLPRLDGRVVISASTSGGGVLGTTGLISSGPPVSVAFVAPRPPVAIMADGDEELRLTVEVLDVNDNFVLAGTLVEFQTTLGEIDESAMTADGVYGSLARATLRSERLGRDYSYSVPDDGIGGTAVVTASAGLAGGHSAALEVDFLTGPAFRGKSRIEIEKQVARGGVLPFEVLIQDRYGNPLGGHVLGMSASGGGTVTPAATTDTWGVASGLFHAPASDTTCVLTVIDNDPGRGGITLRETITIQ